MWLEFWSDRPAMELAKLLAPHIWPDVPVQEGVPFPANSLGHRPEDIDTSTGDFWYELSMNNDHKLDVGWQVDASGRRKFTYRDRYHPEERMDRIERVLRDLGVHDLKRT